MVAPAARSGRREAAQMVQGSGLGCRATEEVSGEYLPHGLTGITPSSFAAWDCSKGHPCWRHKKL